MRVHIRILGWASAALIAASSHALHAQGWGPWGDNYNRGNDQSGYGQPQGGYGPQQGGYGPQQGGYNQQQGGYGQAPVYGYDAPRSAYGSSNPRCRELESQLADGSPNLAGQDRLQRIDADMREADARFRRTQSEADGANCYEDMFFFGRSLRRTPRCIDLDGQIQQAKSALGQLKAQREAAQKSNSPRGRHDDLIADLARNRCGEQYQREHDAQRSRSASIFSFFSDEDSDDSHRYTPTYGASTYRTLCVRECDGFYFPISTATTENQFRDDEAKCRSQCAAPAQLYYHRSDQDVDQMVSLSGKPYSEMPNAFRNRKVYIRGCSCNANEYSREEIAKSEDALRTSKRADASPGAGKSSGSTPDSGFASRISRAVQNAPAQPQSPPAQGAPAPSGPNAPANVPPAPGASQPPANPAR
jgi:hypothetical protein